MGDAMGSQPPGVPGVPGVLRLQSLGYGGVLCLAAVALRASFSGEDVHSHGPMASYG